MQPQLNHSNYQNFEHNIANKDECVGITEITLSAFSQDQQLMLLPMLAHLSHSDDAKWLTWITNQKPSKTLLAKYGFNFLKVRIIHVCESDDIRWILWDALKNGNSHTVVANTSRLTQHDKEQLEIAATASHTRGLIVKNRNDLDVTTELH